MQHIYKLFAVLDRWKGHYIFAGLLLIIAGVVRMFLPKILQVAIDGVVVFHQSNGTHIPNTDSDIISSFIYGLLPNIQMDNLSWVLTCIGLLFVGIALIQATVRFFANVISASSTENAIKALRDRLFSHIQALPLSFFGEVPTGEMIQRCTGDVDTVRNFISSQVTEIIRLISFFFGAFFMMYLIHPLYAFIAICLSPLVFITTFVFFKKESKIWEAHETEQDKLTGIIQENLSGIRVVQAFANEDYEIEKFNKQNLVKRGMGIQHVDLHMKFWPFSDVIIHAQIALSLFVGGYFTLSQQITVGEFIAFSTYLVMVAWPMRQLGQIFSKMGMASVALDRIDLILKAEEEDYEGYHSEDEKLKGDIVFDEVSFRYEEKGPLVLDKVSFKINAGEKIALLGPAGSGKSSIIALLARFYEPESGTILLDGKPLKTYDKTYLRKRVGIVHQDPFLFSTNINENMAYAAGEIEDDTIQEAAKIAAIHDFVMTLPNQYQTQVGEKGVSLSGGQKQRVALTRALLQNPDILVLDDATSAVDTETEFHIQNGLNQVMANKTSIIIAHRLTSFQGADTIIVFEEGKVLEMGSQESLLEKGGFYRKIFDLQSAVEEDIRKEINE